MADHAYPVEVQSDFLEKITRAKPVQALAELVWNGLDADATSVNVSFDYNALGAMSAVIVSDNGLGIPFAEAPEGFRRLGGSWKRPGAVTKGEGRFLHGQDGRGRFKAFSLGRFAEWDVTYQKGKDLWTFKIMMSASNIREVRISDEKLAPAGQARGVTLSISELYKEHRSLTTEAGLQELAEIFALYLADYSAVSIKVDTHQIDPDSVIASRHAVNLSDIAEDDKTHLARLEMALNEADTCRLYVTPKLQVAGWDTSPHSLNEQKVFTDGRIFAAGGTVTKGPQKRADYLLRYTRDFSIAVVEAKPEDAILGRYSSFVEPSDAQHKRGDLRARMIDDVNEHLGPHSAQVAASDHQRGRGGRNLLSHHRDPPGVDIWRARRSVCG